MQCELTTFRGPMHSAVYPAVDSGLVAASLPRDAHHALLLTNGDVELPERAEQLPVDWSMPIVLLARGHSRVGVVERVEHCDGLIAV